jgi:hypothetical protein
MTAWEPVGVFLFGSFNLINPVPDNVQTKWTSGIVSPGVDLFH